MYGPPAPPPAFAVPPSGRPPRPTVVTVAGIGLIGGGALQLVASGAEVGAAVYDLARHSGLHAVAVLSMLGVLAGLATLLGGIQLLRGQTRRLVYAGAIASVVPGTLCCVPGLGFGIYTLVILRRPDARAFFGERLPPPPGYGPVFPSPPGNGPDNLAR